VGIINSVLSFELKTIKIIRRETMEEKEILQEMVNILKPYIKDPALLDNATKETHILDDLKVNSARLVDIIIKCEDVFDIEIDDDDADKIRTIGDAVEIIQNKIS
jgi:acyl carrier protein